MEECATGRGTNWINTTGKQRSDDSGKNIARSRCCQSLIASDRDKRFAVGTGDNGGSSFEQHDGAALCSKSSRSGDAIGSGRVSGQSSEFAIVRCEHGGVGHKARNVGTKCGESVGVDDCGKTATGRRSDDLTYLVFGGVCDSKAVTDHECIESSEIGDDTARPCISGEICLHRFDGKSACRATRS